MGRQDNIVGKLGNKKPKSGWKTLVRLLKYFKHCRFVVTSAIISVVVYSIVTVFAFYQMKPLVNYLEVSGIAPNEVYAKYIAVLIGLAFLYFTAVVTNYLLNRLMLESSAVVLQELRIEMFRKMQGLPIKYFDTHTHGELMSYYTNDIDAIRELLNHAITQLMISSISLVGVIAMMISLSLKLFTIIILMGIVVYMVAKVIGARSNRNFKAQQAVVSKVNGYIEEMIEGQKDVKVFNHEEKVLNGFDLLNNQYCEVATRANTLANILGPIMNNLSHVFYALTTTLGVLMLTGEGTGGVLIAFLQYIRSFAERITQISQQVNFIFLALAGAERVFEIIDEEPETDEGFVELVKEDEKTWYWVYTDEKGELVRNKVRGDVKFTDVIFSYDGETIVLDNISLYAKPGQKIAFVGSTGAGKTTITNLINRFYEIKSGEITFDGINIKDIKKSHLRRSLGIVLQDTHLYTGTVMENIRYGKLDATDEECIKAAKIANADYFISHLPEGYDTMLYSDGANLSQGQRQLIAIARAAVSDPPVLILDEATSSIDTRTEQIIGQGMDSLMEGRTVFVIAHRLSTIKNSKAIMVLEHGNIIERGTHDELLEQRGKYYQLYTGMFELTN